MAVTSIATNNQAITFRSKAILNYVRNNLFSPYMGSGFNSIIVKYADLTKSLSGDQLNVPFISPLVGQGVGATTLVGNEEAIDNAGRRVWIDWARNGVALTKQDKKKASFTIDQEKVPLLRDWGKNLVRDELIYSMFSVPLNAVPPSQGGKPGQRVNGQVFFAPPSNGASLWVPPAAAIATSTQRNTWHTDNSDRVQYGSVDTNYVAGNMSSSLSNLSASTDRMSASIGSQMRDKARLPRPLVTSQPPGNKISPYKTEDEREWYVCFLGQGAYRDLKKDTNIVNANLGARARENGAMKDNPVFQSGDLIYDGVIYREVPEISYICYMAGLGAGGTVNVEPVFLCGLSALCLANGELPQITDRAEDDYGFVDGRGFEALYGTAKMAKTSNQYATATTLKDFDMVTGFVAVN